MAYDALLQPTHLPPSLRHAFPRCRTFRTRALRLRAAFGGITVVMMWSTTAVQSFVSIGYIPRPFERRLEVRVLRRRFRHTSGINGVF